MKVLKAIIGGLILSMLLVAFGFLSPTVGTFIVVLVTLGLLSWTGFATVREYRDITGDVND